jgi:proline iminopeptidase
MQFVEDIEALRQALSIQEFFLLGHSFGAHLAYLYAIKYPHHVSKVISVCGLSTSWVGVGLFIKEFLRRTKEVKNQIDEIKSSREFHEGSPSTHIALYKLTFSSYCFNPSDTEKLNLIFTKESAKNGAFINHHLQGELFNDRFDLSEPLNQLDIPILIIHGEADLFSAKDAKQSAKNFRDGHFVAFKESGHFPFMEQEDQFTEVVTQFTQKKSEEFSSLMASDRESQADAP